ncbi:MAG: xanthine phosphoribosyltransferase [Bdellovibrionota bacterium]
MLYKDLHISWEDLHRDVRALATQLRSENLKNKVWKGIVVVTRGGLIPACLLSKELGIKLIDTFCISTYDHQDKGKSEVLKKPEIENSKDWLVVDDLVDTGQTFRVIRESLPDAHYACVYAKPEGIDATDIFVSEVSQDTWIHFPWDQ